MNKNTSTTLSFLFLLTFLMLFGLQVFMAIQGYTHYLGYWSIIVLIIAFYWGTSFFLMLGVFLGAYGVWDWNILGAIILSLPLFVFQIFGLKLSKILKNIKNNINK